MHRWSTGPLQSVTVEPWWQENGSADFFFFSPPFGVSTRAERRNFRFESKSAKVLDACKVNCRARIRLQVLPSQPVIHLWKWRKKKHPVTLIPINLETLCVMFKPCGINAHLVNN